MSGIHVDPDQMDVQGKKTMSSATDLDSQIKSLTSNKNSLMGIWRGDAAKSFEDAVENQLKNLESFKELINELGAKIAKGANTFYTNEEDNANAAKNLYEEKA